MTHSILTFPQAKRTKLLLVEKLKLARIWIDETLIYEGDSAEVGVQKLVICGEPFTFPGGLVTEFWKAFRLVFRRHQLGLIVRQESYSSPFESDLEALWSGEIEPNDFLSYHETTLKRFEYQDGILPENGFNSLKLVKQAIEKLALANLGAVETPRVNLAHAALTAVKEYGRTANGLTALSGLGRQEAISFAREIVELPKVDENSLIFRGYGAVFKLIEISENAKPKSAKGEEK